MSALIVGLLLAGAPACAMGEASVDERDVTRALEARTGLDLTHADEATNGPEDDARVGTLVGSANEPEARDLPPGVNLLDGLDQEDAVALALWRNPGFLAILADLEVARADVAAAGLLRDPLLSYLFPTGPKQYEIVLGIPLESLWLRSGRIEAADWSARSVAQRLVQNGLDLVLDVKRDMADLVQAREELAWARTRVERLADAQSFEQVRADAGEVSRAVAGIARADLLSARETLRRAESAVALVETRLLDRIAVRPAELDGHSIVPPVHAIPVTGWTLDALVDLALAARPDVRAAEMDVEAACKRLGLSRAEAWKVTAIYDANEKGKKGFEWGPGIAVTLPIFDGGRGLEVKAGAELDRATRRYVAERHRIASAVREAWLITLDAEAGRAAWADEIVPGWERELVAAEEQFAAGAVDIGVVLTAQGRVQDARRQMGVADVRVRKAQAVLEHSVGGRLDLLREGTLEFTGIHVEPAVEPAAKPAAEPVPELVTSGKDTP